MRVMWPRRSAITIPSIDASALEPDPGIEERGIAELSGPIEAE